MIKRAPLDTDLFRVELPPTRRDPLDTLIPSSPPDMKTEAQRPPQKHIIIEAKNEQLNERTKEQKHEGSNVQKNEAPSGRFVIRHTFDIFQDQLVDLKRLQIEAMQRRSRKRKLGQMVQQALDLYIKKMKEKYSFQG